MEWDILFVEREKKEEKDTQKMDNSFTKVYQKDKGKGKIGSVPAIMVKGNLAPLAQDTSPITAEAPTQIDSQPEEMIEEMTKDDIDPESDILFIMNGISELTVSKANSKDNNKDENKVEKKSENKEETVNKEEVNYRSKIEKVVKVNVQTSREDKKPTVEPSTPPSTSTMDYRPTNVIDVLLD
ncbi:uncharacterized protein LOC131858389 [Cryptomeria japonica]|uniref:uncharacterized protein LOC131858389 n=1 Tax=Cryptomeria japonica TaxID=3369 RepID=UPI0027DAB526|nr:uncharacterized protein LOC131858389 [Cryptomeria japonica]